MVIRPRWTIQRSTIWDAVLLYLVASDWSKGFPITSISPCPKGPQAWTWIPSSWLYAMFSSCVMNGWTSIWFITGRISAYESKSTRWWRLKLLTPIERTFPWRTKSSITCHVSFTLSFTGQWINKRSRYFVLSFLRLSSIDCLTASLPSRIMLVATFVVRNISHRGIRLSYIPCPTSSSFS